MAQSEPKYAPVAASSSGDNAVVAAVAGRRVRGSVRAGWVGDSITAGAIPGVFTSFASTTGWRCAAASRGLSASTATAGPGSWLPGMFVLAATTATAGTYTLTWRGQTTAGIAYNANDATLIAALEALSTVGAGNVAVVSGSGLTGSGRTLRFSGAALPSPVGAEKLTPDAASFTGTNLRAHSIYGTAVQQFSECSLTDVIVALGTNDLSSAESTYLAAMTAIVTDLRAALPAARVHLFAPLNRVWTTSDAAYERVVTFQSSLASLADGTNVFAGYLNGFAWTSADLGALGDGLHPASVHYQGQSAMWWLNLWATLDPASAAVRGNLLLLLGVG